MKLSFLTSLLSTAVVTFCTAAATDCADKDLPTCQVCIYEPCSLPSRPACVPNHCQIDESTWVNNLVPDSASSPGPRTKPLHYYVIEKNSTTHQIDVNFSPFTQDDADDKTAVIDTIDSKYGQKVLVSIAFNHQSPVAGMYLKTFVYTAEPGRKCKMLPRPQGYSIKDLTDIQVYKM